MAKGYTSSLFYRTGGYMVGSVKFDLLLSENCSIEAQVSEHPIENGATVSDHVRVLPRKGSLVGLVTNFPLETTAKLPQEFLDKIKRIGNPGLVDAVKRQYGLDTQTLSNADFIRMERPANRAMDALSLFENLVASAEPVTIVTTLKKYYDCIVTKVTTERSNDTGDCLQFHVDFQEIQFVTLSDVEITATTTKPLDISKAASKKPKGKVGGTTKPVYSYNGVVRTTELSAT